MVHYYGDTVRVLFLLAALIMLVSLPVFADLTGLPSLFSVGAILVLGLAAGLTNPQQLWDAGVNAGIAVVGTIVFEWYAVVLYQKYNGPSGFFFTNLVLGFVFFIAIYFSVKTVRGLLLAKS
ncbi:MAG: hypothetical protein KBD66_00030 [Candidatus Doudnabacteria bacterium]|nr:hypothetical protein [Candidatus Doudnabacteria bacterium]